MIERIIPANFVYGLKRRLGSGEALSLYLYELKRSLDQVMPGLDVAARSSLLLHASMLGRTNSISRQLRAVGAIHSIGALSVTSQTLSAAFNAALCTNETGNPESNKTSLVPHPVFL